MQARSFVPPLVLVAALAALAACKSPSAPPAQGFQQPPAPSRDLAMPAFAIAGYDVYPVIYDVPPGRAAEVQRLLKAMSYPSAVVTKDGAQTQYVHLQAQFTSDRHLIITAPSQYHPAIKAVLDRLSATAGVPPNYDVTYWIVKAEPAGKTAIAPELDEIATVLNGLPALGARRFVMLDHLAARTTDGNDAELGGQVAFVKQTLTGGADAVGIELELNVRVPGATGPAVVQTELQVKPGEPVVLGDSAAPVTNLDAPASILLYVVRVRALP